MHEDVLEDVRVVLDAELVGHREQQGVGRGDRLVGAQVLDEAFLSDMIGHHMGAVMMSQQLLMRDLADHAAVDRLAEDIRDEQSREIAMMQRWLRDWFDAGWGMSVSASRGPAPRR